MKTRITLFALVFFTVPGQHSWSQSSAIRDAEAVPSLEELSVAKYGRVDAPIGQAVVVKHPTKHRVERDFIQVPLPPMNDSTFIDVAQLVLAVESVWDTTEPLIIAAFPVTSSSEGRATSWSSEWTEMSGDFDPEFMAIATLNATKANAEIRIEVTEIVRRWKNREAENFGFVLKSISENKSTFRWIRDGRYEGADARLEILYSKM